MASSPMVCGKLHGEECEQQLDGAWAFCARCGRPTSSVVPSSASVLARALPPKFEFPFRFVRVGGAKAATVELELLPSAWDDGTPATWAFLGEGTPQRTWSASLDGMHQPSARGVVKLSSEQNKAFAGRVFRARVRVRLFDAPAADDGFSLTGEPARHEREAVWEWDVALPRPARLRLYSDLLFFSGALGEGREREVRAQNDGDEPLLLAPIHLPHGFELVEGPGKAGESVRLLPDERCSWRVRRTNAPSGRALWELKTTDGAALGEVQLLSGEAASAQASARWIVGVDFGTSGTSVWKRSALDEKREPEVLRDAYAADGADENPQRAPTLIYVRFDSGLQRGFFIGYRALREWERDGYDPARGLLVRELKSLLRQDDEPFIAIHPLFSVDTLLRRFLEELKRTMIEPETGGAGVAIAWNFSLPVLDSQEGGSGELFARQRDRLKRGLDAAGYTAPNCSLHFWTEPFCAAAALLTRRGAWKFPAHKPPRKDDWMLVFDSGGGTTDAVLGQLDFDDSGRLLLREVATLGGFEKESPVSTGKTSVPSRTLTTFGGEVLLRRTAVFLTAFPDRNVLRDNPRLDFSQAELLSLLAARGQEELNRSPVSDPRKGGKQGAGVQIENPWVGNPVILRAFEMTKRAFSTLPTRKSFHDVRKEFAYIPAPIPQQPYPFSIRRDEFDHVVVDEDCLDPLWREFLFQILGERDGKRVRTDRPTREEVRWVFPVGGNCRVARIVERLESEFGEAVQDLSVERPNAKGERVRDDSERLLAVSAGTIWAQDARPAHVAPYGLSIRREGEADSLFQIAANAALGEEFAHPARTFSLPRGEVLRFEVVAEGQWDVGGEISPFKGRVGLFGVSCKPSDDGRPFAFDLRLIASAKGVEVRLQQDLDVETLLIYEFRW